LMDSPPVGGLPRGFDFPVRDTDSAMKFRMPEKVSAMVLDGGGEGAREMRRDGLITSDFDWPF